LKLALDCNSKTVEFKKANNLVELTVLRKKYLFGDCALIYIRDSKDLIDDKNYFTVQIPIAKNGIDIDKELK
jgi:hypothetical protein